MDLQVAYNCSLRKLSYISSKKSTEADSIEYVDRETSGLAEENDGPVVLNKCQKVVNSHRNDIGCDGGPQAKNDARP